MFKNISCCSGRGDLIELGMPAGARSTRRPGSGDRATTPNFIVSVFDLDHEGFDGLLGMNFLRHFNFEVRPTTVRSSSS